MAKQLDQITMFYRGDPTSGTPTAAFLSYNVVDGSMRKDNQVYDVPSPSWDDSPNTIWTAAVAAIKANEGVV